MDRAGNDVGVLLEQGEAFRKLAGSPPATERFDVVVIGGGQSGLAVGHHLAKRGVRFVILDANARIGDAWRKRWDSLRLFTPAAYDGLDGMPFPGPGDAYPTKDQMADYLESYAAHFKLPVRSGVRVDRLWREGDRYRIAVGDQMIDAAQVVIAMANYQGKRVPGFAKELSPEIRQIHSHDYQNLGQLQAGPVLVVGAGNSGAEIAMETATRHPTWMSGRDTGQTPFRTNGFWARLILIKVLFRIVFHRVLTVRTPMGRKARAQMLNGGGGIRIRQRAEDLAAAGIQWVPKMAGVKGGKPVLEDGRVLEVANVVWCTGFERALPWVDLNIFEANGEPRHHDGKVDGEPGLYFVGRHFLHAMSSGMVQGVSRDAARVVGMVVERQATAAAAPVLNERLA